MSKTKTYLIQPGNAPYPELHMARTPVPRAYVQSATRPEDARRRTRIEKIIAEHGEVRQHPDGSQELVALTAEGHRLLNKIYEGV